MAKLTTNSKANEAPKSSSKYYVYVIELKKTVWIKEASFQKKNPHLTKQYDGKCYYVGQTSHLPECRYKQHVSRRRDTPGNKFICGCFTEKPIKREFTKKNRPGRYVAKYHKKGGLRPTLFNKLNPAANTKEGAELAEKKLAQKLRVQGFAVHSA
jgi:hypothetical protein